MSERSSDSQPARRTCHTCGSRVAAEATRCVVCGSDLRAPAPSRSPAARLGGARISLPLPVALVLMVVVAVAGAGAALAAGRGGGLVIGRTPTPSPSITPTVTLTPEPTATETPAPSPTPLPPIEITLAPNLYCVDLAALYDVSLQSILNLNPGMRCELLAIGQVLLIPQPTPTATSPPTATLSPADATAAACERITYTVQANDTLSGIAQNYDVAIQAIMDFNNMSGPTVFSGQVLVIPLCARNPTPGPTPTPTAPPPYPAPSLLLPADGAAFTLANDTVSLQWASVGTLRENEFYRVTVEDVTEGSGTRRVVAYVTDTSYVVPTSLRPSEVLPHIMRWSVTTVRQTGTNASGQPVYVSAGGTSAVRNFTWSGAAPSTTSP